jgi:hypothetical protein
MFCGPDADANADAEPRIDAHNSVDVNVEFNGAWRLALDLPSCCAKEVDRTHLNHQIHGTCPDTANAAAISPPAQNPAGASAPSIANMSERVRPGGYVLPRIATALGTSDQHRRPGPGVWREPNERWLGSVSGMRVLGRLAAEILLICSSACHDGGQR